MIILSIRTDKPEAEIGLYDDHKQSAYYTWQAHRELGKTLHLKIKDLLAQKDLALGQISGIVVFEGPGSFTGLRIGLSVANALAYSFNIPVVGAGGQDWQQSAISQLLNGQGQDQVKPFYGAKAHITQSKK